MAFLDKVLESYRANGIATVAEAEADHLKHRENYQAKASVKTGKTVIEQRYEQREYDPAKIDGLSQEEIEEAMRYDT